jgi:predicted  nucleic acid-binding Zn-ribbon protein
MAFVSRIFLGGAVAAITVAAIVAGCVSSASYRKLLIDTHESARKNEKQVESLSRENQVLYEARLSLEKDLSLANNKLGNVQATLVAEREDDEAYRASTEQKMEELELELKALQEKASKRITEISRQKLAVVDSLVRQIDNISVRCSEARRDYEKMVQRLKDDLAEKEFEHAKETYALTRIKEELFSKLEEKERTIQQLREESYELFAKIAADSLRPASAKKAGAKP